MSSINLLVSLINVGLFCLLSQVNCFLTNYNEYKIHPLSNEFIETVNSLSTTWNAGRNFHEDISMQYLTRLMGVLPSASLFTPPPLQHKVPEYYKFPENFDARANWPHCPTIREIRDQGSCGSCWAISSVEVMSDRTCIYSNGNNNFHYSTEDLMTCCNHCGFGCMGGMPGLAFSYWVSNGIVSGGLYNSSQGCAPYEMPPCEHHTTGVRPNCAEGGTTPSCTHRCESGYSTSYEKDLHFGKISYSLPQERDIMYDLIENGPVDAAFDVYADFLHYKSGVYSYTGKGDLLGGHAIRIIGYGIENATPYWLCANSWNNDWGDHGLFKILRGHNECRIESDVVAGLPKLEGF